jgi:hypothetical protein
VASANFVCQELSDFSAVEHRPGAEKAALGFLIYAIHLKPNELDRGSDLVLATALADYDRALPILSKSLSDTLLPAISKLFRRAFRYRLEAEKHRVVQRMPYPTCQSLEEPRVYAAA